ncbi:putative LPS assembly protein LptD, partial [Vicingaceae bacterium]|nr:putative LPS assembly protein LptD [Vicingaceae bacterium]
LGTKIYGLAQFKKGKLKAIRHVMTPQISYSFTPEIKDGLETYTDTSGNNVEYSIYDSGIFGRPNTNRSNRLNFNLLNVIEMKVLAQSDTGLAVKKVKLLDNFGLNTGIDFERDSLKWDAIRFNGRTRINELININFSGTFDPYAINKESGKRINTLNLEQENKLARFTNGNIAFQMQFRGGDGKKKKSEMVSEEDLDYVNSNLDQFIDFNVPWAFGVSYVISYTKPAFEKKVNQTLNFNGELKLTNKWKVDFNSGYDFEQKDITYTNVNIYRDLHCWELSFNWVPLGFQKSYNVTINVKASVLQDLKLNRRRNYFDLIN